MTIRNSPQGPMGTDDSKDTRPLPRAGTAAGAAYALADKQAAAARAASRRSRAGGIRQGQIYAGRLADGTPAVVRVQDHTPREAWIVSLNSDMLGREGWITTAGLANQFRLVSDGPDFTSEQVAGWLEEAAR